MGFFSDLKEDLSQVMSELLPENASPPPEEELTAEALAMEEPPVSEQAVVDVMMPEQAKEESAEDLMNFDGLKVSLEEMLANLDDNIQLPEEGSDVEPKKERSLSEPEEAIDVTPEPGADDSNVWNPEEVTTEAELPEQRVETTAEAGAFERSVETVAKSDSLEMKAFLQQMLEDNFPEEPEALTDESIEQVIEEGAIDEISTEELEPIEEAGAFVDEPQKDTVEATATSLEVVSESFEESLVGERQEEVAVEAVAEEPIGEAVVEEIAEETVSEPPAEEVTETMEVPTEAEVIAEKAEEVPSDAVESPAEHVEIPIEEPQEETPLEAFAEVPLKDIAEFAEKYSEGKAEASEIPAEEQQETSSSAEYTERPLEGLYEENLSEPAEETKQASSAEEPIEESVEEITTEAYTEDLSIEQIPEEREAINNNQEVKKQMEEQTKDLENAEAAEMPEESVENPAGDQPEESKGEENYMEIEERVAVDETSIITEGMQITGDITSEGSIDIIGTVVGNIDAYGKLNITGHINGNSKAAEIYAEGAKINGEIVSEGAVKIGASSVVIGNISATSAAIAGAVKGDIDVRGPVILDASAIVMGNIKSKSVQINNGAVIEGMCSQCYADVSPTSFFEEYKSEPRKGKNK